MSDNSYWTAEKISQARPRVLEEDSEEGWTWRGTNTEEQKNPQPTPSTNTVTTTTTTADTDPQIEELARELEEDVSLDSASIAPPIQREFQHHYWTVDKIQSAVHRVTVDDDETLCSWRNCDLQEDGSPVLVSDASPIDDDPILKDPTKFPLKLVGLLLFTNSGTHYTGTAFLVDKSTILTAGHNIFLKGDPHTSQNIIWIPGYSPTNPSPFGVFDGVQEKVVSSPRWDGDSLNSSPFDYAVIHLKPNDKGQTPFDALGGLLTIETAVPQSSTDLVEVGFYQASPLATSTGRFLGLLDNPKGTMTVKNGSLLQGASGGPWLLGSDFGKVNGLTSKGNSEKEKSPLFDKNLENFVKANSI